MIPKYLVAIAIATVLGKPCTHAQTAPDQAAITEVVQRLFKGMEKADSAMVHSAFAPQVTMATVRRDKTGNPVLQREDTIQPFLNAVGTAHAQVWYEEIWNIKVQQDGDFAQVWCDYAFYLDHTFHHCGVDALHLQKGKDGWKIFHLADTRRTDNCTIPADIQRKHKQ